MSKNEKFENREEKSKKESRLERIMLKHPALSLFSAGSLSSIVVGAINLGIKAMLGGKIVENIKYFGDTSIPYQPLPFAYLPAGLALGMGAALAMAPSDHPLDYREEMVREKMVGLGLAYMAGSALTAYGINYLAKMIG